MKNLGVAGHQPVKTKKDTVMFLVLAGLAPLLVSYFRPGAAISIGDVGSGRLLGRGSRQASSGQGRHCLEGPFGCPTETTASSIIPGSWGALDSPDGLVIDADTGGERDCTPCAAGVSSYC